MNNFDTSKYQLGKLCKRSHDWDGTGQILRRLSSGVCAECDRASCKKQYRKNKEQRNEQSRIYQQKNLEKCKERGQKYREENREKILKRKKEFHYRNRDAILEQRRNNYLLNRQKYLNKNAQWARENKEWRNQYSREYHQRYVSTTEGRQKIKRKEYRREANKRFNHSSPYTHLELVSRWEQFNNCCVYCGAIATSIDHVIPLSKGGADVLSNLLPSCHPCNLSKGAKDVDTWYKAQPTFTIKRWRKILKVLGKNQYNLGQLPLF